MIDEEISYLFDIIKIQSQEYGIRLRNVHIEFEEIKKISYAMQKNLETLDMMLEKRGKENA